MERRPIIILTALRMEAKAITDVSGVKVHVIGMGARNLPHIDPRACVIVAGLGGALDPTLRVGDLVLDTALPNLPGDLPWHVGAIYTSSAPITTPAEKSRLSRETGALAVDMEQAIVRRTAPADVQVIGLRAISDPADMALDPAVLGLVDAEGRPQPLRVLATLVRRPGLIPHLKQLKSNSELALRNLSRAVEAVVASL